MASEFNIHFYIIPKPNILFNFGDINNAKYLIISPSLLLAWVSTYSDSLSFENLKCSLIFTILRFAFLFALVALLFVGSSVVNGELYFILFVYIDLFWIIFILEIRSRLRERVWASMSEFWEKWVIRVLNDLELSVRVETKDTIEKIKHKTDACYS